MIAIGVDGMDPTFVERHWADLPNLDHLRRTGYFSRLKTTTPPQSPVAWSTFITGLDPAEHGIFDFVHRDPATRELFLSTDRTVQPRFRIALGGYELPLSASHVESLRGGTPFWQKLRDAGIPVMVARIPANYPPATSGRELAGMGTPDLRGTQGTFTFYTDDASVVEHSAPGGLIRQVKLQGNHADLPLEGPPNSLRKDRAYVRVSLSVDVDPERPVARIVAGNQMAVLREGEWSDWLPIDFPLIPHVVSARGMIRIFAKQLHPGFELYVSPVNVEPAKPALPISSPPDFARDLGLHYTLGIAEDTAALRQGVFNLSQFLEQTWLVLRDEEAMLRKALDLYRGGFLFFYFSSVDQNSHMLWGRHDPELLEYYQEVDRAIGEVARREPQATLLILSDHGFSTFDRAVNLNTWLRQQGWGPEQAWAAGLNALYVPHADRNALRAALLNLRDPENGERAVRSVTEVHSKSRFAPDFVVGYSPGYRASWETGLGEAGEKVFETNTDAWIADHCIDADSVPGVLFSNVNPGVREPSLKNVGSAILRLSGVAE